MMSRFALVFRVPRRCRVGGPNRRVEEAAKTKVPSNKLRCEQMDRVEFLHAALRYWRHTEASAESDSSSDMRWILSVCIRGQPAL